MRKCSRYACVMFLIWWIGSVLMVSGCNKEPATEMKIIPPGAKQIGDTVVFTVFGSGQQGLTWHFGDGMIAEGSTVFHVYAKPGTYDVSVSDGKNVVGTSVSIASRFVDFTMSDKPTVGQSITFTANGPVGANYKWYFADGDTANGRTVFHAFDNEWWRKWGMFGKSVDVLLVVNDDTVNKTRRIIHLLPDVAKFAGDRHLTGGEKHYDVYHPPFFHDTSVYPISSDTDFTIIAYNDNTIMIGSKKYAYDVTFGGFGRGLRESGSFVWWSNGKVYFAQVSAGVLNRVWVQYHTP